MRLNNPPAAKEFGAISADLCHVFCCNLSCSERNPTQGNLEFRGNIAETQRHFSPFSDSLGSSFAPFGGNKKEEEIDLCRFHQD